MISLEDEQERFHALKRAAWDERDMALFGFYSHLQFELQKLRAVCAVIAWMYESHITTDDTQSLFEALMDAGLLPDREGKGEPIDDP